MTLKEFYQELKKHDWHYAMSDDHSVWQSGVNAESRLVGIAKTSPEHQKLFDDFGKHHFSGTPWGTVQSPLPLEPL